MLRGQVADLMIGSIFLFIGLAVWAIAGIRRRSGTRTFAWLGLWSAMYGGAQLCESQAFTEALPYWLRVGAPYAATAMRYLLVVAGALSFLELSRGKVRLVVQGAAILGVAIAVAAMATFIVTGSTGTLFLYNSLLATCVLLVLAVVVAVPALSRKYLVLPDRGVLAIGTLLFALQALYVNLVRPLDLRSPRILDHLGFAILLFSFGYVALQVALANERRLLSVENELAIAREIQTSILPPGVPQVDRLRISAAYLPMTAVAGDFYEFISLGPHSAGFLVADVCGHGVPAALIASMIKVAVQTVVPCADDPAAVLRGLNRILSGQLRGRLVSAAYLLLDTEKGEARYSAAGHPPLLLWRNGGLERIESNGLLFGVMLECGDYPVCTMPLVPGDRFLLHTDGVTDPENAQAECFGDNRLEQVLRDNDSCPHSELSDRLLSELRRWQPPSTSQQDDITLIVIDAV